MKMYASTDVVICLELAVLNRCDIKPVFVEIFRDEQKHWISDNFPLNLNFK